MFFEYCDILTSLYEFYNHLLNALRWLILHRHLDLSSSWYTMSLKTLSGSGLKYLYIIYRCRVFKPFKKYFFFKSSMFLLHKSKKINLILTLQALRRSEPLFLSDCARERARSTCFFTDKRSVFFFHWQALWKFFHWQALWKFISVAELGLWTLDLECVTLKWTLDLELIVFWN